MDNLRIAAQMYTVREFTKTLEGIYESLKKIKQAGYDAVQTSGLGPIDDHELKAMTDELGLTICATHVGYDDLKDRLDAVIAQHKLWNCKYVGLGPCPSSTRTALRASKPLPGKHPKSLKLSMSQASSSYTTTTASNSSGSTEYAAWTSCSMSALPR